MNFDKLSEILTARHLTPSVLGNRSGVSETRIAEIIGGGDPTLIELRRIADALGLKVTDLIPSDPAAKSSQLLFRSLAEQHRRSDPVTLANLSRKIDCTLRLLQGRQSDSWWTRRFERGGESYAEAEKNSFLFRELFFDNDQVSPLYSLPRLVVDRMNVLLFTVRAPDLDGASAYLGGLPFIFVALRFAPRMLFTLAHELGHLLSHHDLSQDFAVVDKESAVESEMREHRRVEEQYAHAFASCLLMPAPGVGIALKKIREVTHTAGDRLGDVEVLFLSRIYGVSFAAAAKRCEDLGLIPRGGARSLDDYLRRTYGSAERRADMLHLPGRPPIDFPSIPAQLLDAAVGKIRAGEISVGKAASVLGLSIVELFSANAPAVN